MSCLIFWWVLFIGFLGFLHLGSLCVYGCLENGVDEREINILDIMFDIVIFSLRKAKDLAQAKPKGLNFLEFFFLHGFLVLFA
jgi:hypothetical protein